MTGAIVLLLAAVFVMAAVAKLRSPDAFRTVLRALFPQAWVGTLQIAVPTVELALGIFLLSGVRARPAIACAIVVLGLFTVMLAVMGWRGIKGCACFGEAVNTATTGSGMARNVILIAAAFFAWRESGPVILLGPDVSSVLARLTVVAGSICLWATFSALVNQRKIYFENFS